MTELPRSVADSLHALIYRQRELAYLQNDASLRLVGAGGHLDNYGLGDIRLGKPACEQVFFLEGLLPPLETPQFIRSMELVSGRAAVPVGTGQSAPPMISNPAQKAGSG